ncbi:MAG: hypothetical protein PHY45_07215 [Rhodocyclaceae bacterium]|nr:hypothetical protein [Rhodocyclaceae bacterium]
MKSTTSKWLALAAIACAAAALAQPTWLVTPDEARQDAAWAQQHPAADEFTTRAFAPGAPDISMVSPASLAEPLKAPFPIRIVFKAQDGATIKPESFRALYGFLKVDITERLAGRAKVGPEGISVDSANIPAGNHRIVLRVSDDRDRQGETEIRFTVQ